MTVSEEKAVIFGQVLGGIFAITLSMGPGDRAAMRRGDIGAAYWKVWDGAGITAGGPVMTERWSRLMRSIAHFIGTGADKRLTSTSLGEAIRDAGISQGRFEKMILAPVEVRHDLLDRIVQQLSRTQSEINIRDLASLYLEDEPRCLRNVSRFFYGNQPAHA